MKRLDRSILGQILTSFTLSVIVLSIVIVIGNIFRRLLDMSHDVPLDFVINFILYIIPFSLAFTVPWAILTAVLLTFGRLSADNELIALRALGISIPRLCAPVLLLAALLSLLCFWINSTVAPHAQDQMKRTLLSLATSNPLALFGQDQAIDAFPGYRIYIGRKTATTLENIQIFSLDPRSSARQIIFARTGSMETDLPNRQVLMHLTGATFLQPQPPVPPATESSPRHLRYGIALQQGVIAISLDKLRDANNLRPSLSAMDLPQLNAELARVRTLTPAQAKDAPPLSAVLTEISKRYCFSLAGLAFALVGIPLGITAHRRETSIGFTLSVIIALTYFLFIILADTLRARPELYPHLLIWPPNLLCLLLGLHLFRRLSKN